MFAPFIGTFLSMWLDDARGNLIDWTTQRWVQATGRRVSLEAHPWLEGPIGKPTGIGARFFEDYVEERGLRIVDGPHCGLLSDFRMLAAPEFDADRVSPAIAEFYLATSDYDLDAWSQWCGLFHPFGWALAALFSRRLQQLNVPLSGLDTSRGMSSRVMQIVSADPDNIIFSAWVRELIGSRRVIYAGAYSLCEAPAFAGRCVKVVFPLPNGNAIVIMRPVAEPDGSLRLVSSGGGFGEPGFYFTVHDGHVVWARYLKALRETIHVYDTAGEVRADHVLTLWGATFLRLHYRLRRRQKGA